MHRPHPTADLSSTTITSRDRAEAEALLADMSPHRGDEEALIKILLRKAEDTGIATTRAVALTALIIHLGNIH